MKDDVLKNMDNQSIREFKEFQAFQRLTSEQRIKLMEEAPITIAQTYHQVPRIQRYTSVWYDTHNSVIMSGSVP